MKDMLQHSPSDAAMGISKKRSHSANPQRVSVGASAAARTNVDAAESTEPFVESADGIAGESGVTAERDAGEGSPANGILSKAGSAPILRVARPEELAEFLKDV